MMLLKSRKIKKHTQDCKVGDETRNETSLHPESTLLPPLLYYLKAINIDPIENQLQGSENESSYQNIINKCTNTLTSA